jgi:thiamine monophosphate synthase
MSPDDAREMLGKDSIIGYTANSLEDVIFTNECKSVDYIGLQWNPSKTSRVHSPKVWGDEIRDAISIAQKPVVVIGGITEENLEEILGYLRPGDTVAIGGEILKVDDPFKPTQKLYAIIKSHFERNRE